LAIFAAIRRASSLRLEQSMGGGVFSKDEQGTFFSLMLVTGYLASSRISSSDFDCMAE
jgi:hypothetical protein